MTAGAIELSTRAALPGESETDRRARVTALQLEERMAEPGRSLADLTDAEFESGIARVKLAQVRAQRLFDEMLIENVHYGREKDSKGSPVFKKPIFKQAGAEDVCRFFKWSPRDLVDPEVVASPEYCSVMVHIGLYDPTGRLVWHSQAACNTMEARFKRYDGNGYTYKDAREKLHDCLMIARKRATVAAARAAAGLTAFLSNGEELVEHEKAKAVSPMTQEEKKLITKAASGKSMTRPELEALILATLGRDDVGSGEDVSQILNAIATWVRPAKPPEAADAAA